MTCVYPPNGGVVDKALQWLRPVAPIPLVRTQLYYGVCLLVRLALFNCVYVFRNEWWMPSVVGILSLFSVVRLLPSVSNSGHQWWSKRFQLVISVLVVITCMGVAARIVHTAAVPILLYVSLIGGLVWRQLCCCS